LEQRCRLNEISHGLGASGPSAVQKSPQVNSQVTPVLRRTREAVNSSAIKPDFRESVLGHVLAGIGRGDETGGNGFVDLNPLRGSQFSRAPQHAAAVHCRMFGRKRR
jgi:hypothetical protein